MDYEKKYKEALELARVAAFNGHQSLMEGIFPELAESEDEKARKRIIALVNAHGQGMYKDDMLAWLENIPYTIDHEKREGFHLGYKAGLEKQGESYTKRDVDDAYVEGMALAKNELEKQGNSPIKWNKNTEGNKPQVNHSVLMKTTHGIAEGEWQGEYWHQYRWAGIVRDSDVLSWMELSDLEKKGRQKPADEVETITQSYITPNSEFFQWIYDRLIYVHHENPDVDYMHSLKERIEDMQKPAWSEEDESLRLRTIGALETCKIGSPTKCVDEQINWLKSLKQRIKGE